MFKLSTLAAELRACVPESQKADLPDAYLCFEWIPPGAIVKVKTFPSIEETLLRPDAVPMPPPLDAFVMYNCRIGTSSTGIAFREEDKQQSLLKSAYRRQADNALELQDEDKSLRQDIDALRVGAKRMGERISELERHMKGTVR